MNKKILACLALCLVLVLAACNGSTGSSSGTAAAPSSVASCGTHNGQPFYIGYKDDFGDALAALADVNLSEDMDIEEGASWVAIHVPGGSTRVAVVNIVYDESAEDFAPLTNVGWAALEADEYMSFAAIIPEDTPNLAVVVYSDDWETQQAFALGHSDAGLVLIPATLDD